MWVREATRKNQKFRGVGKYIEIKFKGDRCSLPQECKVLRVEDSGWCLPVYLPPTMLCTAVLR